MRRTHRWTASDAIGKALMSARHLSWLRMLPCVVPDCLNPRIEAHHIRTAANSGMGMKPDDKYAVPCCFDHHREYHNHGRKTFERKYGLDLLAEAERYAAGREMP